MNRSKFRVLGCLITFFLISTCSDSLKEPPGKIYGSVTLSPEPISGENWAYLTASSDIAVYSITSDPATHKFAFDNLKVSNLRTEYYLEAYREGYISYGDSILVEAGVTLSNYNIILQRGARQDTTFQDGISPDSSYFGCLDTYISTPDSTALHGAGSYIIAAGGAPGSLKRGLIHFSFTWPQYFPAVDTFPKEIESAGLWLYVDSVLTSGSVQFAVFNLEQGFFENSANWINSGQGPWPGGPGGSWGIYSSDTVTVSGLTTGWVHFSIDEIAARWLIDSNTGPMMIKLVDESRFSSIFIRSADSDSVSLHPRLRIAINYLQ